MTFDGDIKTKNSAPTPTQAAMSVKLNALVGKSVVLNRGAVFYAGTLVPKSDRRDYMLDPCYDITKITNFLRPYERDPTVLTNGDIVVGYGLSVTYRKEGQERPA